MEAKGQRRDRPLAAPSATRTHLPRYEHRPRDWAEQHDHCPKCGFEGHMELGLMRWWRPVYIADHLAPGMVGRRGECLLVKCKVCSYAWTEDVLEPEVPPN